MMPETFISPCCNKNTLTKDSPKKNRIADFTFCLSGGLKVVARLKKALRGQETKREPGQKDKNGQTAPSRQDKLYKEDVVMKTMQNVRRVMLAAVMIIACTASFAQHRHHVCAPHMV